MRPNEYEGRLGDCQATMVFGRRKQEKRQLEFEAEVAPHLDLLYGAALRLTRNPRDAEDLVQESVLRAFRFFHLYEKGTRFRAWLLKIQTNVFINLYRQRSHEAQVMSSLDIDATADRVPSTDMMQLWSDPERALAFSGLGKEVQQALDRLPVNFRLAVTLADLYDFSYREIAEVLDCPIGTVMSRLFRGRRLLQRSLYHYAVQEGILRDTQQDDGCTSSLEEFRRRKKEAGSRSGHAL